MKPDEESSLLNKIDQECVQTSNYYTYEGEIDTVSSSCPAKGTLILYVIAIPLTPCSVTYLKDTDPLIMSAFWISNERSFPSVTERS